MGSFYGVVNEKFKNENEEILNVTGNPCEESFENPPIENKKELFLKLINVKYEIRIGLICYDNPSISGISFFTKDVKDNVLFLVLRKTKSDLVLSNTASKNLENIVCNNGDDLDLFFSLEKETELIKPREIKLSTERISRYNYV